MRSLLVLLTDVHFWMIRTLVTSTSGQSMVRNLGQRADFPHGLLPSPSEHDNKQGAILPPTVGQMVAWARVLGRGQEARQGVRQEGDGTN
jgi:hypothetical protein